jgi:MOSC domain-containing protein YiiM
MSDGREPTGRVTALVVGPAKGEPLMQRAAVNVRSGRGVEGDRYFSSTRYADATRDLTLIESEALEAVRREHGITLDVVQARRNVVTEGVRLNTLIGRRFDIGGVQCIGMKLCQPCLHLQQLTQLPLLRALVDRGGLRAAILTDGVISVGDEIVVL